MELVEVLVLVECAVGRGPTWDASIQRRLKMTVITVVVIYPGLSE